MDSPRDSARIHTTASKEHSWVNRRGWLVAGGMASLIVILGIGAWRAPTVEAAGSSLFLHGTSTFTLDATAPAGPVPALFVLAPVGTTRTWAAPTATSAAQTIAATTTFTFQYWTTGVAGGTTGVDLVFGYSSASTCSSPTTIAQTSATLAVGSGLSTASFSPSADVAVPAGSFFCFALSVTAVGAINLTLNTDAAASPTNLTSSQTIFIPELLLPLVGLAFLIPAAARRFRSRRS